MLVNNEVSWNNFSNVLYLDSPVGTGYSFYRNDDDARSFNVDQVALDFGHFIKQFYNFHDEYRFRETYIIGQDFGAGKHLPVFAEVISQIRGGTFEDEDFDEMFLKDSKKDWGAWINLKGLVLINPLIDEFEQRNLTVQYSLFKKLVTDVQAYFMEYPIKWCEDAIQEHKGWWKYVSCGIADSFATGNPIYPLMDYRNIKKECSNWFTCWANDELTQTVMNQNDLIEKLQVNLTSGSLWGNWIWTDCNLMDGFKVQQEFP